MENVRLSSYILCSVLFFFMLSSFSVGQLSPSEARILFQVQKLLEYPPVLSGWTNWTSFCYLPPSPSLKILCKDNHITELTITGSKSSPSHSPKPTRGNFEPSQNSLSSRFSIDAFFTVLTKLSNLKVLSLVSLGMWGPLPSKINRFRSLQAFNISSNFIYGEIPENIASIKNLKSLVLADNLFNGNVPDLKSLSDLQELDLGGNHLGPEFPSLRNTLVSITLRNNSFRSEIPSQLKSFKLIQKLDTSYNNFEGPIPPFLFFMPSIQYLNLARNKLSGALPKDASCGKMLKFVDISHNLLVGKLPSCIQSRSSNRKVFTSWNCFSNGSSKNQLPISYCHKAALAVKPPSKTKEKETGIKLGLLLGTVGGILGIIGVATLLVLVIVGRSEDKTAEDDRFEGSYADKMSVRSFDSRNVPQTMRQPAIGLPPYQVFSLEEIEDATNNFDPSNLIGEGFQGQLYKGRLDDGSAIIVTCLKLKQKHLPSNLVKQMEFLSKLRHRHLVSVLGHCVLSHQGHNSAAGTIFIVLENVTKGSLRDYLTDWKKREMLKWPQRMAITIGIARGIQFLHEGIAPGIYGNNIKTQNILLDRSLTAKIVNYDIPLPFKTGAESPLNAQNGPNHLSSPEGAEKEDIYQLGIILLEVITGRMVNSHGELEDIKLQLERSLTEPAATLRGLIDSGIRGTYAYQSLKTAVEIAINCLSKDRNQRPSIQDVLWNMQYSIQVQEGWTTSENLSTQK